MNKDIGILLLRTGFSGMILPHGISKISKLLESNGEVSFGDPLGIGPLPSLILAVFAEVICSILVILGVKTRLSVIPLIITMAVAAFITHGADPWADKELALLYMVGFLTLLFTGGGKYAIHKE